MKTDLETESNYYKSLASALPTVFLTQVNESWSFQVKQNGVKEKKWEWKVRNFKSGNR